MFHVRGRRLVKAARRMAAEPDLKLIDLALDCRFESQEAFTRAFKRAFGVSPGRFRRGYVLTPLEGRFSMTPSPATDVSVEQLPDLVRLEAFSVAGVSGRFDQATKSTIPQLWARLLGFMPFAGQVGWDTFGLVWSADKTDGSFSYMAGGRLEDGAPTPAGLERKDLDAMTYAVFRITLTGGDLHPQVRSAMETIWGQLVPALGLKVADAPDFELQDGDFRPDKPGAVIDFHVPVEV
jgi:AraC family transcriptional regulator